MPEPDVGAATEGIRLWAAVLTVTGLVTGAGAVAAYATGEEFYARGHMTRTHLDAVWVLGVLAAALLVAAFVLVVRISALATDADPARDPGE